MTKIVFLDFDKTVTDIHTGGIPNINKLYWRNFTNKEMITKLLYQLKGLGCKFYLITRANHFEVNEYINKYFPYIFDNVIGISEKIAMLNGNDLFLWAKWKVENIKKIMSKLKHNDVNDVFFFDDTQINIECALENVPNSFKVDYESQHLFELLCQYVLPQTELIYNIPIYNVNKLHLPLNMSKFILRKTSDDTIKKIIMSNESFDIINIFTAMYFTQTKELFGVILDENSNKRFVRFCNNYKIDEHTLIIDRIRNLDEFLEHIHNTHINIPNCSEHKFDSKFSNQINDFV